MKRRPWAAPLALLILSSCRGGDLPPPYRDLAVPAERLASAAALERGRALYLTHCALCHGERGDGRGVRRNLSSHPRDLTDPTWRRRTSPRGIFYVIREGVHGTAMPAWKALDDGETWDLAAYVLSLAES